jgi:predicted metal-dependent hydrolase
VATQNEISYIDNIPITVIRSKRRRSFGIQVKEGGFILRVPSRANRRSIEHSLNSFTPWVRQRQAILETAEKAPTYGFQFGEQFPWLNTKLTLTSVEKHDKSEFIANQLPVHVPNSVRNQTAYIQKQVVDYYKGAGLQHLIARVNYFADLVGKQPRDVKTYSYKRRWGSCSSQGIITFNWSILLAPANVVDYVVVHELAHLIHFDHSKSFWQVVDQVMPNYKYQRKWLKENGHLLSIRPNH